MIWSRRQLARLSLLGGAMLLAGCATTRGHGGTAGDLFFIGSNGAQFTAARLDPTSGDLRSIGPVDETGKLTWSVRHPRLPILYVAHQVGGEGQGVGAIFALRIDRATGALTRIGEVSAGGAGTTHLWFDDKSNTLLAANYTGGSVASIAVKADGSLGEQVSLIQATGSGPHRRQASPHAHGVAVDPSGRFALAADLGTDKLYVYPLDPRTHALRAGGKHWSAPPGSGPRHFAFHPNGRYVYLLGELTAELFVLRWDARAGELTPVQTVSTDAPGYSGNKSVAEVAVSRDGRFVYSSNRGDSAIVVHAIDQGTGKLELVQRIASGGSIPWAFTLHPSGNWMLVANQKSDSVNLFRIDRRTGMLTNSGKAIAAPQPVGITFDHLR